MRPRFGRSRPKRGRSRSKVGRHRSEFGRHRPNLGRNQPNLAEFGWGSNVSWGGDSGFMGMDDFGRNGRPFESS